MWYLAMFNVHCHSVSTIRYLYAAVRLPIGSVSHARPRSSLSCARTSPFVPRENGKVKKKNINIL